MKKRLKTRQEEWPFGIHLYYLKMAVKMAVATDRADKDQKPDTYDDEPCHEVPPLNFFDPDALFRDRDHPNFLTRLPTLFIHLRNRDRHVNSPTVAF